MPKDTKTLGNNKARACESLGFVHKKRLCQRFDTTSFFFCIILYRRNGCQTMRMPACSFRENISILLGEKLLR
ncbi:hypothetical protein, partial [Faecalibacterium prausnitzii]|uniref:hypothetical protein n=1 Tax=Faecalibacterium prausnitzii TaxID=853 RepID=UPI0019D4F044